MRHKANQIWHTGKMANKSAIEWTDATWNPVTGCTKITRGCDNCYAERFAERFRGIRGHPYEEGFDLKLRWDRITQPLSWKRPRRVFVNSMSDLFHKDIPTAFIDRVFGTMEAADWHVFQVLTKRSALMKDYLQERYGQSPGPWHIWCGVSVEDQTATARVRHLQMSPVQVRFLSIEPLLGPVGKLDLEGISWVIVGGESGPNARPMEPHWALDIRDLCQQKGVDFFFKQWGGMTPKSGGRRLEGTEHNAMPDYPTKEKNLQFSWHPSEPPPVLEEHSRAKLDVLRSYLRAYFDRLNVHPGQEEFRLDLVDGFSGGGTFQDRDEIVVGTPLIMLEEVVNATKRLNRNRTKPLHLDCKCYFVDVNASHADHLRKVLADRGYVVDDDRIVLRNNRFEDEAEGILTSIRERQPRAGRAIFLLDQTGFKQVELALVARILRQLPRAEVIMTFAADALVNHLAETPSLIKAVSPLQLTEPQIHDFLQFKDGDGGRALVQRTLREHIRIVTGAPYDTPFFIRPKRSRRALWFLHLSKHPVARDVMIQCHWDIQNMFEHYGSGDFEMLGWDALNSGNLPLFHFEDFEAKQMKEQLLDAMPKELFTLVSDEPITVDAMRHVFANRTAARFSDLDEVVLRLFQEKEFDILSPDGKKRSLNLKRISSTDRIALPDTLLFPSFSRLR